MTAEHIELNDPRINDAIHQISLLAQIKSTTPDYLLSKARTLQYNLQVMADYKFHLLMCGIFGPKYSPITHWETHESTFLKLMASHPDKGEIHFFQSVLMLFKKHPTMIEQAATLLYKLHEREVISEELLLGWYHKKVKLDKTSILYSGSKHENVMRVAIADFIEVVESYEYEYEEGEEQE